MSRCGDDIEAALAGKGHRAGAHSQIQHIAAFQGIGLTGRLHRTCVADIDDTHFPSFQKIGGLRLGDNVEDQSFVFRHGTAHDEPIVMGIDQTDLAFCEHARSKEMMAQFVRAHSERVFGMNGVACLDGKHG